MRISRQREKRRAKRTEERDKCLQMVRERRKMEEMRRDGLEGRRKKDREREERIREGGREMVREGKRKKMRDTSYHTRGKDSFSIDKQCIDIN